MKQRQHILTHSHTHILSLSRPGHSISILLASGEYTFGDVIVVVVACDVTSSRVVLHLDDGLHLYRHVERQRVRAHG